jgi:hypothetical protein
MMDKDENGRTRREAFPLVYGLLPNKTQEIYVRFFKIVKDALGEFSPDHLILDFETAAINAIKEVFPLSCFWLSFSSLTKCFPALSKYGVARINSV